MSESTRWVGRRGFLRALGVVGAGIVVSACRPLRPEDIGLRERNNEDVDPLRPNGADDGPIGVQEEGGPLDRANGAVERDRQTTRVFYTPAYAGAAMSFETTRKSRWIATSLETSPIPGLRLSSHRSVTEAELLGVHDLAYVSAVRTGEPRRLAESQGFDWDPELWTMVLASNGGVLAAIDAALEDGVSGALASGLHHARRDRGAGFCTFNGLALGVRHAQARGKRRILVLDLDAHCGGGTVSLIGDLPGVLHVDVSVSSYDDYTPTGEHKLDILRDAETYLPTVEKRLGELDKKPFDLCIYNAGMDPFEGCAIGGLRGVTRKILETRERLVFDWCRRRELPIAFVLAGGYLGDGLDEAGLVGLHRLTLEVAART
jgi:acetoin utilization deacetylase AcuC-like enzyme